MRTLDFVRAGLSSAEDGALCGLDGDCSEGGLDRLDVLGDSRDCSSGSDSGDQDIDGSVGVSPDFGAGRFEVDARVVRVGKLAHEEGVLGHRGDLLGFLHGPLHSLGSGSQHHLRSKCQQKGPAFERHGFGDYDDHLVSSGGGDHGKANARVSGSRFNLQ